MISIIQYPHIIQIPHQIMKMEAVSPIPSCLPSLAQNSQITHDVTMTRNQDIFCDYESQNNISNVIFEFLPPFVQTVNIPI